MSVDAIFSALQQTLLEAQPDYAAFVQQGESLRSSLSALDQARVEPALRLCAALKGLDEGRSGRADIAVLLRQVCRISGRSFNIPNSLWQLISSLSQEVGVIVVGAAENDTVEIAASAWSASWLTGAEQVDRVERRLFDQPSIGDGTLYAMSGWESYQSEAQKTAVHAFLFAAPGTTTIVTLPTGAGKSLCMLLPAWAESRGGSIKGGTTIVVVPTVALAIDQQRRAAEFFPQARTAEYRPQRWTGDTDAATREIVRRGLRAGTLPLLFLSPEALVHSELYTICLNAAAAGSLTRLVIDEAHLIETWGAGFRTDFQFLSSYRRQLLAASGSRLKTLLLSATLSRRAETLLEDLFVYDGKLSTVHGGRLRPEITYWFSFSKYLGERQQRLLEALRHLPRPLILYTTSPKDAAYWYSTLRKAEYLRVATFTGETSALERARLIEQWSSSQLDMMCATSAFGLGIDKRDVRSVVHACVPENIDRFYQEVGRSGRDGCSAISLVCAAYDDYGAADSMVKSARITSERALARWRGMIHAGRVVEGQSNMLDLDLDAVPPEEPNMSRNEKNREWNEHTLLLSQRAGLVTILETRTESGYESPLRPDGQPHLWMRVRFAQPEEIGNEEQYIAVVEAARESEIHELFSALDAMRQLIQDNAQERTTRCIAATLTRLYPDTAQACGGCPACRREGRAPYADPLPLVVDLYPGVSSSIELSNALHTLLGHANVLNLLYTPPPDGKTIIRALEALLDMGVQQMVVPDQLLHDSDRLASLPRVFAQQRRIPHRIIAVTALLEQQQDSLHAIPTVVLYPEEPQLADQLHVALRRFLSAGVNRINIVPRPLYLASEHGYAIDRLNGLSRELSTIVSIDDAHEIDLI
jgi:ATP-dependent DNA helicase RecQ